MQIIKPPHLKQGDTIGVISPAYPWPKENDPEYLAEYELGVSTLESQGFKIIKGENLGKVHWWSGGTREERASDINELFSRDDVKAIIAHDGGSGCIELLDLLNYDMIKSHPKPLIGFSDITNLHIAIYAKTGLVGFQGPLLSYNLGRYSQKLSHEDKMIESTSFYSSLTDSEYKQIYHPTLSWEWWREGSAQGKLFGGNLSMISSLVGTQYFPDMKVLEGNILFWEIDNVPLYRVQRSLYTLKHAGILDLISGMVIGRTPGMRPAPWKGFVEPSIREIVEEIVNGYSFPILSGVNFGHEGMNLTIPIGVDAKISSKDNLFMLSEGAVI